MIARRSTWLLALALGALGCWILLRERAVTEPAPRPVLQQVAGAGLPEQVDLVDGPGVTDLEAQGVTGTGASRAQLANERPPEPTPGQVLVQLQIATAKGPEAPTHEQIAGIQARLVPMEPNEQRRATLWKPADTQGTLLFESIPAGHWYLEARLSLKLQRNSELVTSRIPPRYTPPRTPDPGVAPVWDVPATGLRVGYALDQMAVLEVVVPIATWERGEVQIRSRLPGFSANHTTRPIPESGLLVIRELHPGPYFVKLLPEVPRRQGRHDWKHADLPSGVLPRPLACNLLPGQVQRVEFLSGSHRGVVRGLVVDGSGNPLADREVLLYHKEEFPEPRLGTFGISEEAAWRVTGRDGGFEFVGVPSGHYGVQVDPLGYVPGRSVDENTLFKPAPLQVVSLTEGQQLDLGSIEIIPARPVELVGRCIVPLPENKTKQQVCDSLSIDVLFNDPRLPRPEGGWRGDDGTVDLEGQFRVVTDRSRKQVFLRLHSNGLFPGSLVLPIDLDSATNGRIDLGDLAYP